MVADGIAAPLAGEEAGTARIVRSGRPAGTVVRCAVSDLLLADLAVSIVFCFDRALDAGRLAAGLAGALDALPVFGGRLRRQGSEILIDCADQGASFAVRELPLTLADAAGRLALPDSGLVDPVDTRAAAEGTEPLLRVRLNRLADGGSALGICWHHAVGDMWSFMAFMRLWSECAAEPLLGSAAGAAVAAGHQAAADLMVDDRDAFLDRVLPPADSGRPGFRIVDDEAERAALAATAAAAPLANRTVQVFFTENECLRLRDDLAATAGRRVSTNDAVTAHVVACVRALDGDAEPRSLDVPVDLRPTLGPGAAVVGNLLGEVFLACPGVDDAAVGASQTAVLIRAAIDDFAASHLTLRTSRTILAASTADDVARYVPLGFDPPRKTFTVSSWRGFGAYALVFDGAAPVFVSPAITLPLPWVGWLIEGFDGRGVLATVAVPAALAARLRSPAGRALLHRCRPAGETAATVSELAGSMRRMV